VGVQWAEHGAGRNSGEGVGGGGRFNGNYEKKKRRSIKQENLILE